MNTLFSNLYIFGLFVVLLVVSLVLGIVNYQNQQRIGVVQIDSLLGSQIHGIGAEDYTKDELKVSARRFGLALEYSLNKISTDNNVLLLVAPAVVSDVYDYTDEVKRTIDLRMKSAN